MDWTDEDKKALRLLAEAAFVGVSKWSFLVREDCNAMQATSNLHNVADTIASKAVDLVAARGGTMTAEEVVERLAIVTHDAPLSGEALATHISAQGARVAVLEAELAKSNKAEFARAEECMSLRERLTAAEEGNRELVRRAQQAETERDQWRGEHGSAMRRWKAEKDNADVWRKRVEAAAEELADVGAGECGRLDIVTRVRMLKARCSTLSAAGQVLSAHGDKVHDIYTCHVENCPDCARTIKAVGNSPGIPDGSRYPCSATCTHDDAATPGHPERVKERSEAVNEAAAAAVEMVRRDNELTRAYENGAEAMRTACLEAVQRVGQTLALGPTEMEMFKSAVEGAAP